MMKTPAAVLAAVCLLPLLATAAAPMKANPSSPGGSDADQVAAVVAPLRPAVVDAARATALPPAYVAAVLLQPPRAPARMPPASVLLLAQRLLAAGRLDGGGWDARQALTSTGRGQVSGEILTRAAAFGYRYTPGAPPNDPQRYVFPVAGPSRFGSEHHDYPATDIFAAMRTPVVACVRSEVLRVSPTERGKGGITITLRGEDGWRYYYAHLDAVDTRLRPGDVVERAAVIGLSGNSGNARSTPPHLHLGLSRDGSVAGELSPYPYLTSWPKVVVGSAATG